MTTLFDSLPDKIFRPLAAANRRFYAALLMHLYETTFDSVGNTPLVSTLHTEIGEFIDRNTALDDAFDVDSDDTNPIESGVTLKMTKGQDLRRYMAYNLLKESGWLVEYRDRLRKLVDLSPEGRLLLRELHRIATGDVRSYGGVVIQVLGNLEQAIDYPDDRSLNIQNAARFSQDFVQHLRTLSGRMRRVEDEIIGQGELRKFFRAFFADYVSKHLITDYKTLYTKNNPFRFRVAILDRVRYIEHTPSLIDRLGSGYVREGRAKSVDEAADQIRRDLSDIFRTFDNIDNHLEIIDETQARIERRVHTTIRYMDRDDGSAIDRVTQALKALGASGLGLGDLVGTEDCIVRFEPIIGEESLHQQRPPKVRIERTRVRDVPPDPAIVAFEQAKEEYARRMNVTPQRVSEFLEEVLAGRDSMWANDVPIRNVDDFIVFQQLRETDLMFNGKLADRFRIVRKAEAAENDWMEFGNFEIRRTGSGDKV